MPGFMTMCRIYLVVEQLTSALPEHLWLHAVLVSICTWWNWVCGSSNFNNMECSCVDVINELEEAIWLVAVLDSCCDCEVITHALNVPPTANNSPFDSQDLKGLVLYACDIDMYYFQKVGQQNTWVQWSQTVICIWHAVGIVCPIFDSLALLAGHLNTHVSYSLQRHNSCPRQPFEQWLVPGVTNSMWLWYSMSSVGWPSRMAMYIVLHQKYVVEATQFIPTPQWVNHSKWQVIYCILDMMRCDVDVNHTGRHQIPLLPLSITPIQ